MNYLFLAQSYFQTAKVQAATWEEHTHTPTQAHIHTHQIQDVNIEQEDGAHLWNCLAAGLFTKHEVIKFYYIFAK